MNDREIHKMVHEIYEITRLYGLNPPECLFEIIDYDEMIEIASYSGFPSRYPHWRFGMEYEYLTKTHKYGLQRIYELVINNEPCYAYLMRANPPFVQKMVIAHVYAHADFFKNNMWFSVSNKKMLDEIANHSTRIRNYMDKYGLDTVEDFIDNVLSLEYLVDIHSAFQNHRQKKNKTNNNRELHRFRTDRDYLEQFLNPNEYIQAQKKKKKEEEEKRKKLPPEPEKDILLFLIEHAPLEEWQQDIISMIREETYYFMPQIMTKIMNEGWATFWHSKILTEKYLLPQEVIDYAEINSGLLSTSPHSLNAYKLGFELFNDIKERWDKGKFGKDYEECEDIVRKQNWDLKLNKGMEKIFEVRTVCNDVTFIENYFTEEFCQKHKLFYYKLNPETGAYEIASRDYKKIKEFILLRLTNAGHPVVKVVDANFKNRAELLLKHYYEGVELDIEEAKDTLKALYRIWTRPVNLFTIVNDTPKLYTFDGQEHKEETLKEPL